MSFQWEDTEPQVNEEEVIKAWQIECQLIFD